MKRFLKTYINVIKSKTDALVPTRTIVGCYCTYKGKCLLLRRHPESFEGGTWCFPSGRLEVGETRLHGALRELYEEIGVLVQTDSVTPMGTLTLNGIEFEIFHTIFLNKPNLKIDMREHTEYKWVTISEANTLNLIIGGHKVLEFCQNNTDTDTDTNTNIGSSI
eukprot:GHVR01095312.1.p1 GENE.GHVR01095312.1~~GHVR01095312.1.p1  ORF type:complete len:164 (+),score=18.72 GHVR01095312.1:8-499(+)